MEYDYKNSFLPEDKCKIHLAEVYTLTKKNLRLTENIELFEKSIEDLKTQVKNSEEQFIKQIKLLSEENETLKKINQEIEEKNKIFMSSKGHHDLINFYEKKIEECNEKNYQNFKNFSQMINKFPSVTRDDVWRNLIKKYEDQIIECEKEIAELKKNERKMNFRQKFFEKYCYKAEERIENFSKITKQFSQQQMELNKYERKYEQLLKETNYKEQKINFLLNEKEDLKNILDKISPIIKLNWKDIKNMNMKNYETLNKSSKDKKYNCQNIINILENLSNYFKLFEITRGFDDLHNFTQIIEDVKQYIVFLLHKIDLLSINQFNIINTCCDLYDKLPKNYNSDWSSIINEVKNCCAKLLFEFNPNNN